MPSASPYELSGKGFLLDEYFEQQDARFVERLRAIVHANASEGPWLNGMIGYVRMVNPGHRKTIQGSKN